MILDLFWRSRGKVAAPIGTTAAVWYLMSNQRWVGEWQGGIQAATNALLFAMPLMTLAAAADARAYLHSPPVPWPRSPWTSATRLTALMFLTWAWSALAAATVLATSLAVNAAQSPFHYPGTLPVLLPFAWTAVYTCAGYLLGRFLRAPLMVVGAVVLAYVAPLVLAGTPDVRPALYSFVDDGAVSPPIFLSAHTLATQLGLVVAISVAVGSTLLVTLRAFGPRLATPMYAVGAAAVLSCIGLTIFGSHNRRYEASGAVGAFPVARQASWFLAAEQDATCV